MYLFLEVPLYMYIVHLREDNFPQCIYMHEGGQLHDLSHTGTGVHSTYEESLSEFSYEVWNSHPWQFP